MKYDGVKIQLPRPPTDPNNDASGFVFSMHVSPEHAAVHSSMEYTMSPFRHKGNDKGPGAQRKVTINDTYSIKHISYWRENGRVLH